MSVHRFKSHRRRLFQASQRHERRDRRKRRQRRQRRKRRNANFRCKQTMTFKRNRLL